MAFIYGLSFNLLYYNRHISPMVTFKVVLIETVQKNQNSLGCIQNKVGSIHLWQTLQTVYTDSGLYSQIVLHRWSLLIPGYYIHLVLIIQVVHNVGFHCLFQAEFADALALKPDSMFVSQMFNIIDRDHNGYISFRELLYAVLLFTKGWTQYT